MPSQTVLVSFDNYKTKYITRLNFLTRSLVSNPKDDNAQEKKKKLRSSQATPHLTPLPEALNSQAPTGCGFSGVSGVQNEIFPEAFSAALETFYPHSTTTEPDPSALGVRGNALVRFGMQNFPSFSKPWKLCPAARLTAEKVSMTSGAKNASRLILRDPIDRVPDCPFLALVLHPWPAWQVRGQR